MNTQGGSGNDTYNGTFSGTAANTDNGTLNSADNLAGGTGTDTALIRVLASFGTAATNNAVGAQDFRAPLMSSVETVLASNLNAQGALITNTTYNTGAAGSATGIATINLVSATGTTTVGSQDSLANTFTEFSNAANGTAISLNNADGYTAVQILGAASRAGTTDALNVTISNGSGPTAASAAATSGFGVYTTLATQAAAGAVAATAAVDNTFEILNITTAGAFSRVNADVGTAGANNSVTTVNVGGTGTAAAGTGFALQLSQNQAFANVTTINASGMTGTGGLYIVTNNAQNLTFTGSANNDRLDLTAVANLTNADVINFGGGFDIIGFSDANANYTAAQKALITGSGAEGLALNANGLTNASLDGYGAALTTFIIGSALAQTGAAGANGTVAATQAITGITTGQTIRVAVDQTAAVGATGANNGAVGVDLFTLSGAGVGTTFTLNLAGGIDLVGGAGGAANAAGGNGGNGANAIDFAAGPNITSITINSTGTSVNTITGGAGGAAVTVGAANNGGAGGEAIISGAVQVYTVTGTQNLNILGGAGGAAAGGGNAGANAAAFSASVNLNASTFTGVLNTSASNAADTIVIGSGGSNIRSATLATNVADGDAITLGSARDQVQILNLGTSNVNTAGLATASMDVITGFTAGVDKFVVGTLPVSIATAATYTAAGTGVLSTDIGTAITAGGAFPVNSAAVVTITGIGAGTYLVIDNGGAGFAANTDTVIQLVGTTGTLSSADFVTGFLA